MLFYCTSADVFADSQRLKYPIAFNEAYLAPEEGLVPSIHFFANDLEALSTRFQLIKYTRSLLCLTLLLLDTDSFTDTSRG